MRRAKQNPKQNRWFLSSFSPHLALLFVLMVLFAPASTLYALDGVEIGGGIIWTGNSRTVIGAPSPLQPFASLGFPFHFGESRFSLAPALAIHRAWYLYHSDTGQAVPAELEHRDVTFLTLRPSGTIRYDLVLKESWSTGPSLSINLHLPIPIVVWENEENLGALVGNLYEGARFILPAAGWYGSFLLNGTHRLLFAADVLFPVHRLWDGEDLPFFDGLGISLKAAYLF